MGHIFEALNVLPNLTCGKSSVLKVSPEIMADQRLCGAGGRLCDLRFQRHGGRCAKQYTCQSFPNDKRRPLGVAREASCSAQRSGTRTEGALYGPYVHGCRRANQQCSPGVPVVAHRWHDGRLGRGVNPSTTVGVPRVSSPVDMGGRGKRQRSPGQCGRQAAAKDQATGLR